MEKLESITWRNANKIPSENKEYFIYGDFDWWLKATTKLMSSVQSQPFLLLHKILLLKCCFQSCLADAAKIVRSWVPLSPSLVTLPLCNKDVIEIPSSCTRKELSSAFCNKKTWRTPSSYSGKRHQQGHALRHGCKCLSKVSWV